MATFTKPNKHLTLPELYRQNPRNYYLPRVKADHSYPVLTYPRPELHVSHLSHSTDLAGLQGIQEDGGFRDAGSDQDPGLVWFSLTPTPADLSVAEGRPMTLVHHGGEEEVWDGGVLSGLLQSFATSPAFSSSSRYGSYRLTFDLSEVLDSYSEQFCGGQPPILRMEQTVLYKQEVMYVVLVHSPDNKKYENVPLLEESENCICVFKADPTTHFIWRSQAMSETHRFSLKKDEGSVSAHVAWCPVFYVWDHVTLALDVGDKVLQLPELRESLRFCERNSRPIDNRRLFQEFKEADAEVQKLWPESGPLQEFKKSDFHINN